MSMVERVLEALQAVKASNYDKAPPLHRFCWGHGILIPPPMLAGFWFNVALLGITFGVLWGVAMAVLSAFGVLGFHAPAVAAVVAGSFFGLAMAAYARLKTAKYDLPSWKSLVEAERAGRA